MDKYYVITNSDGETMVEEISKEELEKRLQPDERYYGNRDYLDKVPDLDTNYWGEDVLIIKGSIVVPEAVEVVTQVKIK